MMTESLPALNALLNTTGALLLIAGRYQISRGNRSAHRACMLGAVTVSVLFLVSYLTYHSLHGSTRFLGEGWIRTVYFIILGTHTVGAAAIVPLVLITLRRGLKGDYARHRKIARWTFPLWLYVSVTGVIVYLLLYQIYPHG